MSRLAVIAADEEPIGECGSKVDVGHIDAVRIIDVLDLECLDVRVWRLTIVDQEAIAPQTRDDDVASTTARVVDGAPFRILLETVLSDDGDVCSLGRGVGLRVIG